MATAQRRHRASSAELAHTDFALTGQRRKTKLAAEDFVICHFVEQEGFLEADCVRVGDQRRRHRGERLPREPVAAVPRPVFHHRPEVCATDARLLRPPRKA